MWDSWHLAELAAVCERLGPASLLDNTVELSLVYMALGAQVSKPQGWKSGRAGPAPQKLQHVGEWALHHDWAAQWSWLWRCG